MSDITNDILLSTDPAELFPSVSDYVTEAITEILPESSENTSNNFIENTSDNELEVTEIQTKETESSTATSSTLLPEIGDYVKFFNPETENEERCYVYSSAGKKAGGNRSWLNVSVYPFKTLHIERRTKIYR